MSAFELIREEAAMKPRQRKFRPSTARLCVLMRVSRSGYYDWCKRVGGRTDVQPHPHERLVLKIRSIQEEVDWVYGPRRLREELVAQGESVGRRLVRRLVREFDLYPVQKKLFKKTTDSNHDLGFSPNLLEQNFTTNKPNEVWVSDITYIWTGEGWSYLATVIDLYSRRIVGWAMDSNMKADLVVRALQRALTLRSEIPLCQLTL